MKVSKRPVCRVLGQDRSTQCRLLCRRAVEEWLIVDMIELRRQYGRYGHRPVAALLRDAGRPRLTHSLHVLLAADG